MKKLLGLLLTLTLIFTLVGCIKETEDLPKAPNGIAIGEHVFMTGEVAEIDDETVRIINGEYCDNIIFAKEKDSDIDFTFEVGEIINVGYDGTIMESYPCQATIMMWNYPE